MPHRRLASSLRSRHELARQLGTSFDKAPVALILVSPDGSVHAANRRFTAELGYAAEDFRDPSAWWELAYPDPDYRARAREAWEAALVAIRDEKRELAEGEFRVVRKDGSSGEYLIKASFLDDSMLASFTDVTEKDAATRSARESERRFRNLFDDAPLPMAIFERSGRLLDANRRFDELFGRFRPGEDSLETIWPRVYPDAGTRRELKFRWLEAARTGGMPFESYESKVLDARMQTRYVLVNTASLGEEILVSFIDITTRKKAEHVANAAYDILLSVSEGMDQPIYVSDPRTYELLYANDFLKRERGDPGGLHCYEYIHGLSSPCPFCTNDRIFGENVGKPYIGELFNALKGRWYHYMDRAIRWPDGRMVRYETAMDITDRRLAEAALAESLERYRALAESATTGIWQIGRDDRSVYMNPALKELLQLDPGEDISGVSYESFFAPSHIDAVRAEHEKRARGVSSTYEAAILGRKGRTLDVLVSGVPLRDADGAVAGTMATLVDITERKRVEATLRKGEERLRLLLSIVQSSEGSAQGFLDTALDAVIRLTDSRLGYIYLYDEAERMFTLNSWSREVMDRCAVADPKTRYRLEETGIWGEAVRQRKTITVNDFAAPNPLKKGYLEGHVALERFLTVPIVSEGRIVAVTGVANKEAPYDESDALQITLLMDGVWKALEKREAKDSLIRRERRLREQNEAVLDLLVNGPLGRGDLDAALRGLTELASRLAGVERVSVWSYSDDELEIRCSDLYTASTGLHRAGDALRVADCPEYAAAHGRGELIVAGDIRTDPRTKGLPAAYVDDSGIRSLLDAPIRLGPAVRGIVSLEAVGGTRDWSLEDERLATMLATVASLAFQASDRARAEESLRRLNAELEEKVASRTEGLARAMASLRETQDKMLVTEKLAALGRLMAGIAHELNTPIAAIASSSRIGLRVIGEGFDGLAAATSRLGPGALAFLGRAMARASGEDRPLFSDPATERSERRAATAVLEAAGVRDAGAAAEDLVELGLADMAAEAAPLLAAGSRDDVLTALRATLGVYRASRVAQDAAAKAERVVAALRTYARGGEDEPPSEIRLAEEIRGLLDLYYNRTKRGIAIALDVPDGLGVLGRREAVNRIWFNLINNAVQAVGDEGRIDIRAAPADEDGVSWVVVTVTDSGAGIAEEIRHRIFEPFFTTKPPGEGTGLGLDIARRLARDNGGDISFESRPGRTVFSVRLPRATRKDGR